MQYGSAIPIKIVFCVSETTGVTFVGGLCRHVCGEESKVVGSKGMVGVAQRLSPWAS
jgi:hypothetical protein